jgi:hypothetical protein
VLICGFILKIILSLQVDFEKFIIRVIRDTFETFGPDDSAQAGALTPLLNKISGKYYYPLKKGHF